MVILPLLGLLAIAALAGGGKPPRPLSGKEIERLRALSPRALAFVLALRRALASRGIQIFVGETKRTPERQEEHYEAGRSARKGGPHLKGQAADLYVIDPRTGKPDTKGRLVREYLTMANLARRLGGNAYGYKPIQGPQGTFTDPYHVEYRA